MQEVPYPSPRLTLTVRSPRSSPLASGGFPPSIRKLVPRFSPGCPFRYRPQATVLTGLRLSACFSISSGTPGPQNVTCPPFHPIIQVLAGNVSPLLKRPSLTWPLVKFSPGCFILCQTMSHGLPLSSFPEGSCVGQGSQVQGPAHGACPGMSVG